jgi:1,4-dihydroxy-2-naphthoate octaprenyltransferase
MQVNEALEHHKALLTTRQKTARVTSFVSLALLIGVLLVPVLFITQADYQPDVVGVLMFAFLGSTYQITSAKSS